MKAERTSGTMRTILLLAALSLALVASAAGAQYSGGSGTADDPYQVTTAADLIALGETPDDYDKHFILTADIDLDPMLPGCKVFHRAVIAPDQDGTDDRFQGTTFTGYLNGNGHVIANLVIEAGGAACDHIGLFGVIDNGRKVYRLGVVNARIDAGDQSEYVGALAGTSLGFITACYANAEVVGDACVGGLFGHNGREVIDCYAEGTVVGRHLVGGLAGDSSNTVTRCYSTAVVRGSSAAGGLLGWNSDRVNSSFWDIETSGRSSGNGGIGLTTEEMMAVSTYSLNGWAESRYWILDAGNDYPRLAWQETPGEPIPDPAVQGFAGAGTAIDPYRIETVSQLERIGQTSILQDKHYILMTDLDLGDRTYSAALIPAFDGTLNGNGHLISRLTIDGTDEGGLFGVLDRHARIRNLGLEDAEVTGSKYAKQVGVMVGRNNGTLVGCYASASVSGFDLVGVLVGYNDSYGTLLDCYAKGSAVSPNTTGGLAGYNAGFIVRCYGSSFAHGADGRVGGLTGQGSGTIINSYVLDPGDGGGPDNGKGQTLSWDQLCERTSFTDWRFQGASDRPWAAEWFQPEGEPPVLSWQTPATDLVLIPDLEYRTLAEAQMLLLEAGFSSGDVTYDYHREVPALQVISAQRPGVTSSGNAVNVVVSSGPYDWAANPGIGTEANPYEIATAGQLESLTDHPELWDRHYVVVDDIDMAGRIYSSTLIAPDANSASSSFQGTPFAGHLDGQGHTIYDFQIVNWAGRDAVGLFGGIGESGCVEGLLLNDAFLQSCVSDYGFGLLCGFNRGHVTNCHATGYLVGRIGQVGGLVAANNGTIRECSVHVHLNGSENVGGLVGSNDGTIVDCSVEGTMLGGTYRCGGLAGENEGSIMRSRAACDLRGGGQIGGLVGVNRGTVSECHAEGTVYGGESVGGLMGYSYSEVSRCSARATTTGSRNVGGLVGYNEAHISDCYAHGRTEGEYRVGGLVGYNAGPTVRCWAGGSLFGGDGSTRIGGLVGHNSPQGVIQACLAVADVSTAGTGTYLGGLVGLNNDGLVHGFWDIQASGMNTSQGGRGQTTAKMMDADFYSLNGWGGDPNWTLDGGTDYPHLAWENEPGQVIAEPLFDWLEGEGTSEDPYRVATADQLCKISVAAALWDKCLVLASDIDLAGCDFQGIGVNPGMDFAGTFDGAGCVIRNMIVRTDGASSRYLGLFGSVAAEGQITRLGLENALVEGGKASRYLGLLVGHNRGTVTQCFADGGVHAEDGSKRLGGFMGYNTGDIIDCYACGEVSTGANSEYVGGFVGESEWSDVRDCFAAVSVLAGQNSPRVGGLAGSNAHGSITHCYYLSPSYGGGPVNGHGAFLSEAGMKKKSSFMAWDFDTVWTIDEGNDYPRLWWEAFEE